MIINIETTVIPKKISSSIFVDRCLLNGDTNSAELKVDSISSALEFDIPTIMEPL